ncbi:membrane-spanning 4-domains subfamily A member 12-like isoform X4 [Falco biarmicus]|uniref:membrane-spanning 4-domains subfamily A member 12-like isoform X4 n=1 Tax=Falco cherrug TaxID=345164 RepID=UPI0024790BBC|nr:membrane-spanning 4-domains subfamily A member 12-like isoform X4 [Falco cherrug]XP_056209350.1 membrane-spanning 4-domains subfamily A member 12-like isoform X4 [Falco biarmicus]
MQGMGSLRLGSRAVMYTAETLPKGKNRVMGTIQIMTGFMYIGFGIVLTTLTSVYTSVFVIGEIPFLGGVSFIISGCLSIGAEKSPTECAVKGSQTMNIISAIFALLGIVAFIVDLNLNGLYRSSFDYYSYLIPGTGFPSCCSSSPSWSSASLWPPLISGAGPPVSAPMRPC